MPLSPGQKLGPYEILAPIGAGGMGEVYRARDTRLDREVALKVSAERFSERFEREAKAIAALNHPNICHVYDVGPNYLVMEYIEGESPKGPMPLEEVMRIARQIAAALESAHEKGITHRDLKPANIKIKPDGTVKVLDFGLAKVAAATAATGADSATVAMSMTQVGMIVGTPAYMAPEQARGNAKVDRRADIWAFGVVLYELLTGKLLFQGEDNAHTLATVIMRDPDLSGAPPEVAPLLRSCLQKDPARRLRDIGDMDLLLGAAPQSVNHSPARRFLPWIIAAVSIAAALGSIFLRGSSSPALATDSILTIAPTGSTGIATIGNLWATPEISPDGSSVIYRDNKSDAYLRRLDSLAVVPLQFQLKGWNQGEYWSPDSKYILFSNGYDLEKMVIPDGAPEAIAKIPGPLMGLSLSANGDILFGAATNGVGLYLIPGSGGEPRRIEVAGLNAGSYFYPEFIGNTGDFMFAFLPQSDGSKDPEIRLSRLADGKASDSALLTRNVTAARYTPAKGGRLLFVRNDGLYAQKLNLAARKLEGDPELVASNVACSPTYVLPHFSVARNGVIAWRPGRAFAAQVTTFDRQGKVIGTAGRPESVYGIKLSPDGRHLLVAGQAGLWMVEENQTDKLEVSHDVNLMATLWSRDGSHFLVPEPPRIVERPIEGAGADREIARLPGLGRLEDLSPDGKTILYTAGAMSSFVSAARLEGTDEERKPKHLFSAGELAVNVRFSPDGHWLVYQLKAGGVHVQPFPGPGLRKQLSHSGYFPIWRKDGKEIVYLDENGEDLRLWSIRVDQAGAEPRFSPPEPMFSVRRLAAVLTDVNPLAVSRDGSRIYFPVAIDQPDSGVIHVRLGWASK